MRGLVGGCAGLARIAWVVTGVWGTAEAQSLDPIWGHWLSSLQAQGYSVTQGSTVKLDDAYCQQVIYPSFRSCFENDPIDPYIVPLPPVGAGYVDPYFGQAAAQTDASGVVVGQIYHLDVTQALLVIVVLPPFGAYLSYESYLFTRPVSQYSNSVQRSSPDPSRLQIFGSFNNSVDEVGILRQSGLGFGQGSVAFITTANSILSGSLCSSFTAVGGNTNLLFTEAMGSNLDPGLDQTSDDFTTAVRYSVPQNLDAGNRWRAAAATNVQVFRIVQPASMAVARYGSTPLLNKSYNAVEGSHNPNLTELNQIMRNWLATEENDTSVSVHPSNTTEKVNKDGVMLSGQLGPYCIANGTNCAGDSQDTDGYKTTDIGTLAAGRMFIVDGVNHSVTNNTTYLSVSVSDNTTGTGITGVSQTNPSAAGFSAGAVTGSALAVLQTLGLYGQASKTLQADLPNLYVQFFTRPCDPAQVYCSQPYTTSIDSTALPYADTVLMTERAYVLPGVTNGANPTYLVNPYAIY